MFDEDCPKQGIRAVLFAPADVSELPHVLHTVNGKTLAPVYHPRCFKCLGVLVCLVEKC